jgi:hypothetical protein
MANSSLRWRWRVFLPRWQARHQAHAFGAIQAGLPLARLVALALSLP